MIIFSKKTLSKIVYYSSTIWFLIIIFALFYSFVFFKSPNQKLKNDTFVVVNNGDSFTKVSYILAKKNIISNQKAFLYISRILKGKKLVIKSGEYLFEKNAKPKDVLKKLLNGNIYYRKLTFAEGMSTHTILQIIDQAEGLNGELPKDIKEGRLLPETYLYTKGDSKTDVVNRMQKAMNETLNTLWESRDKSTPIKTKEQALTLASIVEKETGVPNERGLVASVFINRLTTRMKLQSDPTVVYSFAKGNIQLEREIRQSDLKNKSPYNTYYIYGLPPTPIANPSVDAIKAVLNPPKTKYLFFVATGNGGHNFATNLRDHNNFVHKYRKEIKGK